MSLNWMRKRLGKTVLCLGLGLAAFGGAPLRPEEIEELLQCMNQPKVAHTISQEDDEGDPRWPGLRPVKSVPPP